MTNFEKMKTEITVLVEEGEKLCKSVLNYNNKNDESDPFAYFLREYEEWYTQAKNVVKVLSKERYDDFINLYSDKKRKEISVVNYTISDALRLLSNVGKTYSPASAYMCLVRQCQILHACLKSFDSSIWDIQNVLQSDIFDTELDAANHLLQRGFLRAAGAICGVVLEKHLKFVCTNRGITINKKNLSISDYNDSLKDEVYDTIEWRRLQRLGDIRNLCDHSKDREPTKDEVLELIAGTERTIKTIF